MHWALPSLNIMVRDEVVPYLLRRGCSGCEGYNGEIQLRIGNRTGQVRELKSLLPMHDSVSRDAGDVLVLLLHPLLR